jgi:hypothetical protein
LALSNVLDPTYVPTSPDDIDLWDKIQTYAFSALNKSFQTNKGRAIILKYSSNGDAQKAYNEYYTHMKSSTKAVLAADELLQYITNTRFDKMWNTTAEAFIIH